MTQRVYTHFGFTAGVLSPAVWHRADLEKYGLGLRSARNWLVDFGGGVSVRPGLRFLDYIEGSVVRLVPFSFNLDIANNYLVVFGDGYIRFVQNGAYVLEAAQTVAAVSGSDLTVTAHGYAVGDWLKIDSETFEVTAVPDADTITVAFVGPAPGPTPAVGASVARIYTIAGLSAAELEGCTFSQYRDEIIITSTAIPPKRLQRFDHTDWRLNDMAFVPAATSPDSGNWSSSVDDAASVIGAVAAVDASGREAPIRAIIFGDHLSYIPTSSTANELTWSGGSGAERYEVYKATLVNSTGTAHAGMLLGWASTERGKTFTDMNVVPDFQKQPLLAYNPFANGAVQTVEVTAGGSGYTQGTASVSITSSTGSGFIGVPIVENGAITGVVILDPGSGYDPNADTVVFSDTGTGSGATATFTTSAASGNWPACSTVFEERRYFAGTVNNPTGLYATRLGTLDDFSRSQVMTDASAFELAFSGPELTPIKHLVPSPFGLIAASNRQVYLVQSPDASAITGLNAISRVIDFGGAADVPMLLIDDTLVFLRARGVNVQMLRRGPQGTILSEDISVLSRHFFEPENSVIRWTWAGLPDRRIWCVKENGRMLVCTFLPSQNVFAWTEAETAGRVADVTSIRLRERDSVAIAVWRNGRLLLEELDSNHINSLDDAWAVDSALQSEQTYSTADLTYDGSGTFTASTGVAVAAGDRIRWRGNVWKVTAVSGTTITVEQELAGAPLPVDGVLAAGTWSYATPVSSVGGLWHLEGQTVAIFGDGVGLGTATVTNGSVALPTPASNVVVGLPFTADFELLPWERLQAQRGRITEVVLRLYGYDQIGVGARSGEVYRLTGRRLETMGQTDPATYGLRRAAVASRWSFDDGLRVEQTEPLRTTVSGVIVTMEV